MGMVSGIEKTKSRVTVYVDGVAFLRLKIKDFEEMPLSVGEDLDEEGYIDRLCARQAKAAYETALNLLTARDMTSHDLSAALRRRGYQPAAAEAVCDRLRENRLIDDERYAKRFVELRQDAALGRYALRRKLRARGIDEKTADEALEAIDDESQLAAAKELAARLARRYEKDEARARRSKLSQALARRGFSWEIIGEALDGLDDEDADW